ncbi:MAG: NAD(P)/FAD-dependent oxidoreductase [Pseudolabrys sp.]
MSHSRIIIVGAGQAGVNCALALREFGFAGDVTLLSDETHEPYDRPPLSKELGGAPSPIVKREELTEKSIVLRLCSAASAIDRVSKTLTLSDGTTLPYDSLVLATGGSARALPSLPADGRRVFALRTLDDAHAIDRASQTARNALVLGGGWLGLESTAALRKRGCAVTLLEAADRLCARSVPAEISTYLHDLHSDHGAQIATGATAKVTASPDGITAQWNGATAAFDMAVVAIGLTPHDALARQAGLACQDGILTDDLGRTDDPAIFAIGDVARIRIGSDTQRLESWKHAIAQGRRTAQAICGVPISAPEAPWFWSEQYDRLIQVAGLPHPGLSLLAAETEPHPLWRYGAGNDIRAVIGVNRARDLRQAHRTLSTSSLKVPA